MSTEQVGRTSPAAMARLFLEKLREVGQELSAGDQLVFVHDPGKLAIQKGQGAIALHPHRQGTECFWFHLGGVLGFVDVETVMETLIGQTSLSYKDISPENPAGWTQLELV